MKELLKYKVLVVDDEEAARKRLANMLLLQQQDFIVEFANNGLECLEKMSFFKPDLVFLDIQMPGMTGIEVVQQLSVSQKPKVIFQTAYDEFATQAFEHAACDYLLKPVKPERLSQAIEKALTEKIKDDVFENLSQEYQRNDKFIQKLTVKHAGRLKNIAVAEIVYIKVQEDYSAVNTKNSEFLVDQSLSYIEKILDPKIFVRCHRSYIINIQKIESIQLGRNMNVVLSDAVEVPVSRQKRAEVRKIYSGK